MNINQFKGIYKLNISTGHDAICMTGRKNLRQTDKKGF